MFKVTGGKVEPIISIFQKKNSFFLDDALQIPNSQKQITKTSVSPLNGFK
jgi:hypothetical protein